MDKKSQRHATRMAELHDLGTEWEKEAKPPWWAVIATAAVIAYSLVVVALLGSVLVYGLIKLIGFLK